MLKIAHIWYNGFLLKMVCEKLELSIENLVFRNKILDNNVKCGQLYLGIDKL